MPRARHAFFAGDGVYPYMIGQFDTTGHPQLMNVSYDANDNGWASWHTIGGSVLPNDDPSSSYTSMGAVALSPSTVWVFSRGLKDNSLYVQKHEACAHDLCKTGVALTDTCDSCANAVCDNDTHCCSTSWDSLCVEDVETYCGMLCN